MHFAWRSGASSGKTTPISVALSAHETRLVDVAALQEQNVIPMEAEWASVFVTAPGVQPDELMAVAMSYDEAGRYGAQTPFNDQLAGHWEGDQWQVDSTHNSLITAGNGGTKPVTAKLTLFFNHGQGKYELERMVAPEEQPWVDVGQLIHDQTLDRNGKSLPPGATSGAYKLEEVGSVGVGNLFEGKLILDKTYGSTAYGCMVCCGHFPGTIDYNPLGVPVQGDNFQGVTGVDGCTGDQLDTTDNYTTWWTGSTTIATANLNDIHGVGLGSTPHYARGTIPSGTGQQCHLCCPSHTQTIQASTNVGKKVYLVGTNCNVNPSVVFSGSWGDPAHLDQCALVDPLLVPSGGSCIQEGTTKTGTTKYCYQTNHNGCVTTYCPVDTRIMDSACTRFLDQSGDTVSSTPAGCS